MLIIYIFIYLVFRMSSQKLKTNFEIATNIITKIFY